MTTEEDLRAAGRYARIIPGELNVIRHYVRTVTDGRGTYRHVFHLFGTTYIVLKEAQRDHPYQSVKIWSTSNIERTYDSWKTKIPVEISNDEIIDAYSRAVELIFNVVGFIIQDTEGEPDD